MDSPNTETFPLREILGFSDLEKLLGLFEHYNDDIRKKSMLLLATFFLRNPDNLVFFCESFNAPLIDGKVI